MNKLVLWLVTIFLTIEIALIALPINIKLVPLKPMKTSYYGKGDGFHGKKTANGERFNKNEFTAAHKKLPFNTYLLLTNPKNDSSVIVRINDRGPFIKGRELDVSYAVAKQLDFVRQGTAILLVEEVVSLTNLK